MMSFNLFLIQPIHVKEPNTHLSLYSASLVRFCTLEHNRNNTGNCISCHYLLSLLKYKSLAMEVVWYLFIDSLFTSITISME
jgi:hypothetical protein